MDALKRASELFDQGKYRDAIGEYSRALEKKSDAGAHHDRGAAYHRLERYDEAVADYRRAVQMKPRYGWAWLNLGVALQALGRTDEAVHAYEESARVTPGNELRARAAIAGMGRGPDVGAVKACVDEAEAAGDSAASLKAYDRAVAMDASFPSIFLGRALVQEKLGDPAAATADLNRALALRPDYAHAYLERGRIKSDQGQNRPAVEDASRALDLDPEYVTAYNNRAAAYITLNEYERAIVDCNRAIELDPGYALAWLNRGIAYQETGRFEEALAEIRKAVRLRPSLYEGFLGRLNNCEFALSKIPRRRRRDPNDADLVAAMELYEKSNEHDKAGLHRKCVEVLTMAIGRVDDLPLLYVDRGYEHSRLSELDAAIADYRRATDLWPGYLLAYNNIADSLVSQEKYDEARAAAEEGLALFPIHPKLLETLARARDGLGDVEGAVEAATGAMSTLPNWAKAHWTRACSRWKLGDFNGTIEDMKRAAELDASYADDARQWIQKAREKIGGAPAPAPAAATSPYQVEMHGGGVNEDSFDFFFGPPPEIGGLLSAQTSLTKGETPTTFGRRLMMTLGGVGVGLAIGTAINWIFSVEEPFWFWAWPCGLGGLGLLVGWLGSGFEHACTYVGVEGLASYRCKKRRDHIVNWSVMKFADARELRTSETRHYTNGVYTRTAYRYGWTNADGRMVWSTSGDYQGEKKLPASTDAYHFCLAAENSWSAYLMERAEEALNQYGFLHFSIRGSDYIRVAPGWVELSVGGKSDRREASEVASVSLSSGKFTLSMKDAKRGFFRSTGIFEFDYGQMANVKLFMLSLEKLAGIEVV